MNAVLDRKDATVTTDLKDVNKPAHDLGHRESLNGSEPDQLSGDRNSDDLTSDLPREDRFAEKLAETQVQETPVEQASLMDDIKVQDPNESQRSTYSKIISFTVAADADVTVVSQYTDPSGKRMPRARQLSEYLSAQGARADINGVHSERSPNGGLVQVREAYYVLTRQPDGQIKYTIGVYHDFENNSGQFELTINGEKAKFDASGQALPGQQERRAETSPEIPKQQTPQPSAPERQTPERQVPEKQTPERQVPEQQIPERQTPEQTQATHALAGLAIDGNTLSIELPADQQLQYGVDIPGVKQYEETLGLGSDSRTISSSFTRDGIEYNTRRTADGTLRYSINLDNATQLGDGLLTLSVGDEELVIDPSGKPPTILTNLPERVEGKEQFMAMVEESRHHPVYVVIGGDAYSPSGTLENRVTRVVNTVGEGAAGIYTIDVNSESNTELQEHLWDQQVPVLRAWYNGEEIRIRASERAEGISLPNVGVMSEENLTKVISGIQQAHEAAQTGQVF